MTRSTDTIWQHRFAILIALSTLFLVALGGVVTTKGVGMAVPDWPTTYGHHMFFFPFSHWYAGIFAEHSHRVWASIVGILAAAYALYVWVRATGGKTRWLGVLGILIGLGLVGVRTPAMFIVVACVAAASIAWMIPRAVRESAHRMRWFGLILFAAVIVQGVLGGLRVILDHHGWGTEFGIFHAMLAQCFFVFVCSLVIITSKWWARANEQELNSANASRLRFLFAATTALIFVQILLGATMRHQHQGLAVPEFPLAYGKVWPETDAQSVTLYNAQRMEAAGERPITAFHIVAHMLHRYTGVVAALVIVAVTIAVWRRTQRSSALRKLTGAWVVMVLVQVLLGIFSIISHRKVDVTTAHVALGALTLMWGWAGVLMVARLSARQPQAMAQTAPDEQRVRLSPA